MEKQIQIIVKEAALNDLEKECLYIAENYSIDYSEKFRLAFFAQIKTILPNPLKYPECRFLPTKSKIYRNIIWRNYLIVFKVKQFSIEVLVLFHTKQRPSKLKAIKSRKL
jgi:plasmid stabilization system protein ParE